MKIIILFILISLTACNQTNHREEINNTLDSLHYFASMADQENYINLFSSNAVFFGTDIAERWPIEEFKTYLKSRFDTGTGWTYKKNSGERN